MKQFKRSKLVRNMSGDVESYLNSGLSPNGKIPLHWYTRTVNLVSPEEMSSNWVENTFFILPKTDRKEFVLRTDLFYKWVLAYLDVPENKDKHAEKHDIYSLMSFITDLRNEPKLSLGDK